MSRIDLTDNFMSSVVKLAEGNPGACVAAMEMAKASPLVDPDSALGPFGPLLSLDTNRIYGSRIWMLYSDLCDKDATKSLGLLRAVQLGLMTESTLNAAIDSRGTLSPDDVDAAILRVKEKLPAFAA